MPQSAKTGVTAPPQQGVAESAVKLRPCLVHIVHTAATATTARATSWRAGKTIAQAPRVLHGTDQKEMRGTQVSQSLASKLLEGCQHKINVRPCSSPNPQLCKTAWNRHDAHTHNVGNCACGSPLSHSSVSPVQTKTPQETQTRPCWSTP